jgi:hypothetical protein
MWPIGTLGNYGGGYGWPGPAQQWPPEGAGQGYRGNYDQNLQSGSYGVIYPMQHPTYAQYENPGWCFRCNRMCPWAELVNIGCGHLFCSYCLINSYLQAITGDITFPPRCLCQKLIILSAEVYARLPNSLTTKYLNKLEELGTEPEYRVYCTREGCHTYVPRRLATLKGLKSKCPQCGKTICLVCKGDPHGNVASTEANGKPYWAHWIKPVICNPCGAIIWRTRPRCMLVGQCPTASRHQTR